MYAIIKTGGKQYRVAVGDVIDVELLDSDVGSKIEFSDVLYAFDGLENLVGEPIVSGFHVAGEVLAQLVPGDKVTTLKYKPNHTVRRKWGHRQKYTRVKITSIGKSKNQEKGA